MLAVFLSLAFAFPTASVQAPTGTREPIELLGTWVRRFARPDALPTFDELARLRELVADVRMTQVVAPQQRRDAVLVLLDLAAFAPRTNEASRGRYRAVPEPREQASQMAFEALEHALELDGGATSMWLATDVLSDAAQQSTARRRAALELLRGRHEPPTLTAIMSCALDEKERAVRDAAMTALEGWNDDGLHRFMLGQLDKNRTRIDWIASSVVYRHFARVKLDPESASAVAVRDWTQRETSSDDWRRAVAGIRVLSTLDDRLAVPVLIEGLSLWLDRRALDDAKRGPQVVGGPERNTPGHGSRRVEGDFERCLKARSGRNLGLHPESWARWWRSAQSAARSGELVPNAVTRASFFGLHPWTDRVVLVLDRSASMNHTFDEATDGSPVARYTEALRQMRELLRDLGPQTRFRVVLFSSEPDAWNDRLVPATDDNLSASYAWAAYEQPEGGTNLRAAIEQQVLRLDKKGDPDLKRIEEDTVIVLCDGETSDGPNWVRQVLDRANSRANLVFHSVQIGGVGDGTLERLAEMTGGEFVHVDD